MLVNNDEHKNKFEITTTTASNKIFNTLNNC